MGRRVSHHFNAVDLLHLNFVESKSSNDLIYFFTPNPKCHNRVVNVLLIYNKEHVYHISSLI